MKTRNACLAVFVVLAAALVQGAPRKPNPLAYGVESVRDDSGVVVAKIGTHQDNVLYDLGRPYDKITKEIWIYSGFEGSHVQSCQDGCDMLMIRFEGKRVAEINLLNCCSYRELAANPKMEFKAVVTTTKPVQVAKK
jgi:hypothetical protein